MTTSDSTPDFSWLNKKDSENDEPSKEQPESSESDSVQDDAGSNEEDDEGSSEKTSVNPTAETWIQESPELSKPFAPKPVEPIEPTAPEADEKSAIESDSVFDDDSDDEATASEEQNDETLIMPGRKLSESDSERLNTSNNPEDLTVVLPPDASGEANPVSSETFEKPDADPPLDDSADEVRLNVDELEQTEESVQNQQNTESDEANAISTEPETTNSSISESSTESAPASSAESSPPATEEEKKSNTGFILLASYASAMTLIALFLLMKGSSKPVNQHLESLPDVKPEPAGELSYVPVNATLPTGHVLKIGDKQRFGNIEVEPLRVVKEPIQFAHYSENSKLKRPPTKPVIKLWLKFTNVSSDQEIAPLDGDLLLRWVTNSEQQREFANQYLFPEGATTPEEEISTYRHSKTSDWDLRDQKLGMVLEPGESYETYIASTDNLPGELSENLNWRVQFRKGYSPKGYGVTTIIDVTFRKDDIKTFQQSEKPDTNA